ncbi:MAG: RNA polymerase sigma factor [Myxococcota bacterium]
MAIADDAKAADEERWSEWMTRAQQGDRESYASLLAELSTVIESFLRVRFGSATFVEDCAQDALLSIHRSMGSYDPKRPFRPWLFAIVRRRVVDELRRRAPASEREAKRAEAAALGPTGQVERALDGAKLLARLSPDYRDALVWTKFAGYSIAEAAEMAGVSQVAMKTRVSRAVRAVRREMERESGIERKPAIEPVGFGALGSR